MLVTMLDREQIAPRRIRPLRRAEYDRMVELGMFGEDERIELLRGALVKMSPQKAPHASVTRRLTKVLMRSLGDRAEVSCQFPFAATDDSEPEPDIAVVPLGDYEESHPGRAHLIIEVAWDSVAHDRDVKARIYAEARVPEYWLVNLVDDVIEVFTRPARGRYARTRIARRGDTVTVAAFPDVTLAVTDILPAKRRRKRR